METIKSIGSKIASDMEFHNLCLKIADSFIIAMEVKDYLTAQHCKRTSQYAASIAVEMELLPEQVEAVRIGASLHDIGKIGISELILGKPAKLTRDEYKLIKEHPVIGEKILAPIELLRNFVPLVRSHHERYDGYGYPDGLVGEDIPLGARIIAVASSYDAMAFDTPYRKAMNREDIIYELRQGAGNQFDPYIVEAFLDLLEREALLLEPRKYNDNYQ